MRAKKRKDQEFSIFISPKLQHESSLSKKDHIKDFSVLKDSNIEKQTSYANKN